MLKEKALGFFYIRMDRNEPFRLIPGSQAKELLKKFEMVNLFWPRERRIKQKFEKANYYEA